MNFELPPALVSHLKSLDSFINSKILPLQHSNDNNRFFDHRREFARTDWEHDGIPRKEWEELLGNISSKIISNSLTKAQATRAT